MSALSATIQVEFKLFTRTFVNMFFVLAFPSMMLLIFGGIYGNDPMEAFGGRGTIDVSVPAYCALVIAVTAIMSLPLSIANYREKKVLKRFRATPLNPTDILVSQIVVNLVMTAVGIGFLFVLAKLVFNVQFTGNVLAVAFAFLLSTLSMFAVGFVIASLAPGIKSASAIANIVYFPMVFLTGATLPLELMPKTMQNIAKALPLTYVVSLMKGVWIGESLSKHILDMVVLAGILIAGSVISILTFKWE